MSFFKPVSRMFGLASYQPTPDGRLFCVSLQSGDGCVPHLQTDAEGHRGFWRNANGLFARFLHVTREKTSGRASFFEVSANEFDRAVGGRPRFGAGVAQSRTVDPCEFARLRPDQFRPPAARGFRPARAWINCNARTSSPIFDSNFWLEKDHLFNAPCLAIFFAINGFPVRR